MNWNELTKPLTTKDIQWRVGATNTDKTKAIPLAYVDARMIMERLDDICGPENWQCRYPVVADGRVVCEIGIRVNNEWVWKADGAGDTYVEKDKGAMSDAFKRAAFRWGIARHLYDIPNTWEPISNGKFSEQTIKTLNERFMRWQREYFTKYRLRKAMAKHGESVQSIKDYIAVGNLSAASEAWVELGHDAQKDLWVAPTKGGPFTSDEQLIIRSDEFTKANILEVV